MNATALPLPISSWSPRQLAAAPHRLLFFVGAANVLLAMGWWAAWLVAARWRLFAMPNPAVPAGWMHALVMQYQVLIPFVFGFLLTVFPRWLDLPALAPRRYLPVGLGLLGGQALTLVGLAGVPHALWAGLALTALGWAVGWATLLGLLWRARGDTPWHALSAAMALGLGLAGLGLALAYATTGNARLLFAAIKFGSFGLLLPIYFTVCHRMLPFFAGSVVAGYRAYRPMWVLAALWAGALVHLGLELAHGYAALWLVDVPLAALGAWLLWRWWPRGTAPALLRVLFIGFAWMPLAFALFAAQSAWYAATGEFALGRAPAHALFVGYFGSLLVAMVTRVTQGHSGRPLELGRVAGFAFVVVQAVAMLRVLAEVLPDAPAWQALAALGWLLAFAPWVARSAWIYLTPRADGRPG